MDNRFNNPFICELEETGCFPDIVDSPPLSDVINNNAKLPSTNSSPKRSKRSSLQKRVVTVPITDVNGSRLKGEGAPPSDSWAWRKYGQKPIKGSPYPRGYYRCSSSKGCPARKQVERSRVDPTMLVITYACEHNHTWPASKNSNNNNNTLNSTTTLVHESKPEDPTVSPTRPGSVPEPNLNTQFADLGDDSLVTMDDFSWFSDVESTRRTVLDTPICTESSHEGDVAMIFQMREEDESLFGDLGELPECSVVFGREQRIRSCATSIDCGGILKSTGCVSCATRYQNFQNY